MDGNKNNDAFFFMKLKFQMDCHFKLYKSPRLSDRKRIFVRAEDVVGKIWPGDPKLHLKTLMITKPQVCTWIWKKITHWGIKNGAMPKVILYNKVASMKKILKLWEKILKIWETNWENILLCSRGCTWRIRGVLKDWRWCGEFWRHKISCYLLHSKPDWTNEKGRLFQRWCHLQIMLAKVPNPHL